jgi:hypothetical protein
MSRRNSASVLGGIGSPSGIRKPSRREKRTSRRHSEIDANDQSVILRPPIIALRQDYSITASSNGGTLINAAAQFTAQATPLAQQHLVE